MGLLSALVRWSLDHRALVLVATLLFMMIGVRSVMRLPIDVVPDVTNVQVQVLTSAPALSPLEIEQYVSIPIERSMAGIPHVMEMRSLSKYGMSIVTLVFEEGTDIYRARALVNERMREAGEAVSSTWGRPEMAPISTGLGEVFQFTVENPSMKLMELEELLHWNIAPQLRSVPGIVEVNILGGHAREYRVVADPVALQAMRISPAQLVQALVGANAATGGGYIEHDRQHYVITGEGLVESREELEQVVVRMTEDGSPIRVADIASVRFEPSLRRGAASADGEGEVVVGLTLMLMGENSRTVTDAIKRKVADIELTLPAGTQIRPFYDRSLLVDRTIRTVATNLLEGAALVIVVLLLLLGDVRAGLVVAATIPLAMLFAIVLMDLVGVSGNLMSLGAIDFGLIVDGAVIVVDNAVRRLAIAHTRKGAHLSSLERAAVVRDATLEVRSATVFGEAIIAIVYLPILSLSGIEGKLFQPMAMTVLFALAGAFVLSLTVIPVLTSYVVRARERPQPWLLRQVKRLYEPLLAGALHRRASTMFIGVAAIIAAAVLFTRIGAEFVPQLDEGELLAEVRRLPGVSLRESVAMDLRMERALSSIPEVQRVVAKTGSPELAFDPMGIDQTDIFIMLEPRERWREGLDRDQLASEIERAITNAVPEVAPSLSQPIQMRTNELVAGVRSDVGIIVHGPQLEQLKHLGEAVLAHLDGIPGVVDARMEQVSGLNYLRIVPDRQQLARHGLTVEDLNLVVQTLGAGRAAGVIREGERQFPLTVRLDRSLADDLGYIADTPLYSPLRHGVVLGELAELELVEGPALVNRSQQSRRLIVEFNVRGRDLVSTVEQVQQTLQRELLLPTGYRLDWGGTFEHYLEAKARLWVVVPTTLGLILFLLWTALGSVTPALVIFSNVPFAVVGGVVALWLCGIPFSISAGVGFIALFGVSVLNGLVLVSVARHLESEGIDPMTAIRRAGEARLRPVLMTAFVAAFGFVPMAVSNAPGSEVQRPLATVVIGGLVSATLLTLVVLPAVYATMARRRRHS